MHFSKLISVMPSSASQKSCMMCLVHTHHMVHTSPLICKSPVGLLLPCLMGANLHHSGTWCISLIVHWSGRPALEELPGSYIHKGGYCSCTLRLASSLQGSAGA